MPKPKDSRLLLKVTAIAVFSLLIFFVVTSIKANPMKDEKIASSAASRSSSRTVVRQERAVPVVVTKPVRRNIQSNLVTFAEIKPNLAVDLAPETSGIIKEIYVDVGDTVNKKAKLAQIKDEIQQAQYKQALAGLEVAKASIRMQEVTIASSKTALAADIASEKASESRLNNLKLTKDRLEKLFNEGALARQDLDNIISQYDAAQADLARSKTDVAKAKDMITTAEMALEMRKAELETAKANANILLVQYEATQVEAPFDGIITARHADPGAMASPGVPIFRVEQTNPVKVVCSLAEKDMPKISEQTKALIKIDVLGEKGTFEGEIAKIYPTIDRQTRTGKVEIHVDNHDYAIKAGMFANVYLTLTSQDNAITLSRDSIGDSQDGNFVFVVKPDNRLERRSVTTGITEGTTVEIISGINGDETIVYRGLEFLQDGMSVISTATGE